MRRAFLLVSLACIGVPLATATLDPAQRQALAAFFNATGGPAWKQSSGWAADFNTSNDPCTAGWYGVTCDPVGASASQNVTYVGRDSQ